MSAETSAAAVAAGEAAPALVLAAEGSGARPSHLAHAWATALKGDERQFYIGLICAVVLHALLLIGVIGFAAVSPDEVRKRIGDKGGELDGVSIEMVSDADFRNRETVPLDGGQPPAQPNAAAQPTQAAKPTPPQQQPAERAPEQQQKAEPQQKSDQPQQKQAATAITKENPDLLTLPDLTGKPPPREQPAEKREVKPTPQQQPPPQPRQPEAKPQQARPNLQAPPSRPGENYASFSRPAGITRSGENDDFARGVIRALRQTMPPGRGNLGRVTIRLLLSENGNLQEVQMLATTGNGALTQDVVFSSKQSNFPFPPKGATAADRTFQVTYIYD